MKTITRLFIKRLLKKYATPPSGNDLPIIMYNDLIGMDILLNGYYEKDLVSTIMDHLDFDSKKMVCLDIGANIGNHSLQFKNHFATVHSFEPQKRTYQVLALNTKHLDNITTHNFGLSNTEAEVEFKIPTKNTGAASSAVKVNNNYYLETVSLKVFDKEFDIDFSYVKIDVEGNELTAILGMEEALKRNKPVISFEYNQSDKDLILEKLNSLGYKKFFIPQIHIMDRLIPSNFILLRMFKLLGKIIIPNSKNKLAEVSLPQNKNHSLITTYHPLSNYKLKH